MSVTALKDMALKALFSGLVLFFCCHGSLAQDIRINNTSTDIGKGRYKFTLFVEADASVLKTINFVEYDLHPAFDEPERKIYRPRTGSRAFSTSDIALRPFKVGVIIYFKDGNEMRLEHTLKLRSSSKSRRRR